MARVASERQALHGRHRRPRRDPPGAIHTFHLRPVLHGFAGGLSLAIGTFFFVWPIVGLFTPGFYKGSSAWGTAGALLMGCGIVLVCAWAGIRQFRNGARVSDHKLTIRNELRTYAVAAADIRAINVQPKSGPNNTYWVARVELTGGKSIWIDNFECGPAGKPPNPDRVAAVEQVRALLGVRADDTGQSKNQPQSGAQDAEAERLPAGMAAGSEDPDHALPEMARQDRKGTAVTAGEDGLDETQARINHREAIIRKTLRLIDVILWVFLIMVIPDPSAGETDVSLPAWLWWGIGIAGVMLALTALAFRTNVPRRIAEIITADSNEFGRDGVGQPGMPGSGIRARLSVPGIQPPEAEKG